MVKSAFKWSTLYNLNLCLFFLHVINNFDLMSFKMSLSGLSSKQFIAGKKVFTIMVSK